MHPIFYLDYMLVLLVLLVPLQMPRVLEVVTVLVPPLPVVWAGAVARNGVMTSSLPLCKQIFFGFSVEGLGSGLGGPPTL